MDDFKDLPLAPGEFWENGMIGAIWGRHRFLVTGPKKNYSMAQCMSTIWVAAGSMEKT